MIHSKKPRSQGLVDIITAISAEYIKPVPVLAYDHHFVNYIPMDNLPELLGCIIEDAIDEGQRSWTFNITLGGGYKENDWGGTPVELYKECYFGDEAPELYDYLYECGEDNSIDEFETPIQIVFHMKFYN
tara:strand:+ start:4576 stop:4965 length:390 start_codon:yes stop_codon:yes gene_type:complete